MKKTLLVLLVIVAVAAVLHLASPVARDTDSFYHIRHAWIYRTSGLTDSSFPWAQFSVTRTIGADLWYGFHLLLVPLTLFEPLTTGILVGGFFVTVVALFLIYAAFKKIAAPWPLFWALLLALATPDVLYRLTMLRPHPLSLGLTLLIFAYLVEADIRRSGFSNSTPPPQKHRVFSISSTPTKGSPAKISQPTPGVKRGGGASGKSLFIIFLSSALLAWIHLALAWLPVLVALVISGVRALQRRYLVGPLLSVFGGLAVGILARPNPLGGLKLAYIQVVKVLTERLGELPIRFGRELTPYVGVNFLDQLLPLTLLVAIGLGFVIWLFYRRQLSRESSVALWASIILALGFGVLAFSTARRAGELAVGFGIIFLALVFAYYYRLKHPMFSRSAPQHRVLFRGILLFFIIIVLIYMPIKTIYRYTRFLENAFPLQELSGAGEWLRENAEPGAIVFNPHWDRFGQLFFWNPNNYYINGMDPIFLYAFNPELYWKTHYFATGEAGPYTCGQVYCDVPELEDTYSVLKSDFKASYVMAELARSSKFYSYLSIDRRFEKVFDSGSEVIFRLKDADSR